MKPTELEKFLDDNGLSNGEFADMVAVTPGAVSHWLNGIRKVPPTVVKLIKVWTLKPSTMKEFLP